MQWELLLSRFPSILFAFPVPDISPSRKTGSLLSEWSQQLLEDWGAEMQKKLRASRAVRQAATTTIYEKAKLAPNTNLAISNGRIGATPSKCRLAVQRGGFVKRVTSFRRPLVRPSERPSLYLVWEGMHEIHWPAPPSDQRFTWAFEQMIQSWASPPFLPPLWSFRDARASKPPSDQNCSRKSS